MKRFCFLCIIAACLASTSLNAAITSVTLTAGSPTTLSNGMSYYCAGNSYTFRIQAYDALTTAKADWTSFQITLPGATSFTINAATGAVIGIPAGVNVTGVIDNLPAGPFTNIDYTITVTFRWDSTPVASGVNNVGYVVTNVNGIVTLANARTFNFGVISQIAIAGFTQTDDAADGFVNPWHDAFNLTGRVVYYIAGQSITTQVPVAEITGLTLYRNAGIPAGAAVIFSGTNNNFQYAVPAAYFAFGAVTAATATTGPYTWSVTATMVTGGVAEAISSGTLGVTVGMVSVSAGGLTFVNGGGVNAPYYVRSVNVAGTQLRIATMAAMNGTVTFGVNDGTNTYNLQVLNGAASGTVLITPLPAIGAGGNVELTYTVQSVTGGVYGNTNPANGQNSSARILNSTGYACRWENTHWPGYGGTPFTAETAVPTATATSFRLQWAALSPANAAPWDADFYTYRVYYRRSGDPTWLILDRSNTPALGNIATTSIDVGSIANPLEPLTAYEYQVSAIDVFGNEVPALNRITNNVTTAAITVEASVTDGISIYNNASFNFTAPAITADPGLHVVRKTAIKVTVYIVTAGAAPEQVNIIIANNDSDGTAQFGLDLTPPPTPYDSILSLAAGVARWTIPCVKVSANTYEALIPSEHSLMAMNSNIRFIVQTVIGGVPGYYDHSPDPAPPGSWTQDEWRFRVAQPVLFIPWPTKVLNNVLTRAIPCCWPAYFLTFDSLVTIKVYDIKGRVICILADNMYRPGGQNIKENGWCGVNKDNRRVGPGLYYIHIKAKTIGGKVTLDKMLKVVVAH